MLQQNGNSKLSKKFIHVNYDTSDDQVAQLPSKVDRSQKKFLNKLNRSIDEETVLSFDEALEPVSNLAGKKTAIVRMKPLPAVRAHQMYPSTNEANSNVFTSPPPTKKGLL